MRNLLIIIAVHILGVLNSQPSISVPLKEESGTFVLEAKINGYNVDFTFDPGSYIVVINPSLASTMFKNGVFTKDDIIGKSKGTLANGDISSGTKINIRELSLNGVVLFDVEATILDGRNTSMLLGQSALKKLEKYSINNVTRTLEITPYPEYDFEGDCVKGNCENGLGKFVFIDNAYYEGNFVDGKYHGVGRFVWANGDIFIGTFVNGVRDGKGTIMFKDGTTSRGNWEMGGKEGLFTIIFPNGNVSKEFYKNNELVNQ